MDKYLVDSLVKYSGLFLKWTREELQQMAQRTRKLMTIHVALHSRYDVDRFMCREKKVEEDSPAFKIALMNRYNDKKTT